MPTVYKAYSFLPCFARYRDFSEILGLTFGLNFYLLLRIHLFFANQCYKLKF